MYKKEYNENNKTINGIKEEDVSKDDYFLLLCFKSARDECTEAELQGLKLYEYLLYNNIDHLPHDDIMKAAKEIGNVQLSTKTITELDNYNSYKSKLDFNDELDREEIMVLFIKILSYSMYIEEDLEYQSHYWNEEENDRFNEILDTIVVFHDDSELISNGSCTYGYENFEILDKGTGKSIINIKLYNDKRSRDICCKGPFPESNNVVLYKELMYKVAEFTGVLMFKKLYHDIGKT